MRGILTASVIKGARDVAYSPKQLQVLIEVYASDSPVVYDGTFKKTVETLCKDGLVSYRYVNTTRRRAQAELEVAQGKARAKRKAVEIIVKERERNPDGFE
jgi:hypothetical protein